MHVGNEEEQSQDFDLNLAPIIDCLTVLITFMLASMSFLAVGILEVSVANPGPAVPGVKPPAISLEVQLGLENELLVKTTGKQKEEKTLPSVHSDWDIGALETEVERIKQLFPDTQSIVISAKNDVSYVHFIRVMEAMKTHFPVVLMGGFE